jgi:hypothetical protein
MGCWTSRDPHAIAARNAGAVDTDTVSSEPTVEEGDLSAVSEDTNAQGHNAPDSPLLQTQIYHSPYDQQLVGAPLQEDLESDAGAASSGTASKGDGSSGSPSPAPRSTTASICSEGGPASTLTSVATLGSIDFTYSNEAGILS